MSRSRRLLSFGATALALAITYAAPATAQGRNAPCMQGRMYDVATEATLSGTVTSVTDLAASGRGRGMGGTHVLVDVGSEVVEVHLGPSWYMKAHDITLQAGDAVTVLGSRVKMGKGDAVIARRVDKGGATWTLRDDTGRPLWAGTGRAQQP